MQEFSGMDNPHNIKPLEWREYTPGNWTAKTVNSYFIVRKGYGEDDEDEDRYYLNTEDGNWDNSDTPKQIAEERHIESIEEFLL